MGVEALFILMFDDGSGDCVGGFFVARVIFVVVDGAFIFVVGAVECLTVDVPRMGGQDVPDYFW